MNENNENNENNQMPVYLIIEELNEQNGSTHKLATLEKYKNNQEFVKVLEYTMDTVKTHLRRNYEERPDACDFL